MLHLKNWMFAVPCGLWGAGAHCGVHPSVCSDGLHSSGKNFQQTLPGQYLGTCLEADKRLLNQNVFLLNLHVTWICLHCL